MRHHLYLSAVVGSLAAGSSLAADLDVTVRVAEPGRGTVYSAVYDSSETFMKPERAVHASRGDVAGQAIQARYTGLPAGRYAVSAFQDLNGNGELDTNILGMPTEPYGFSAGARGSMGPPAFSDAAVALSEGSRRIDVTLK